MYLFPRTYSLWLTVKQCRQRFYDWHHDVQRNANDVVYDAILKRQNSSNLSPWQRGKEGIIEWLQDQLNSGAAYYEQPRTANVSGPACIILYSLS